MHLSQNQKFFLNLFAAFLKFALNFEFFEKKMTLMANVFFEFTDSEKRGWINV